MARPRTTVYRESSSSGQGSGTLLFLGILIVVGVLYCARSPQYSPYLQAPQQQVVYDQFGKPMPMGVPMGQPGAPCGYPGHGYPHHGYGDGYSGMAVAGSAATGFMGGMLVSEMMHNSSHHHHHSDGGDYGGYCSGGGYSSGGDYGGGDYGGGGDGGFASDS